MDAYAQINRLIRKWDKAASAGEDATSFAKIKALHETDPVGSMRLVDRHFYNAVEEGRLDVAAFLVGKIENFGKTYVQDAMKLAATKASKGQDEWKKLFLLARTSEGENRTGLERSIGDMVTVGSHDIALTIVQGIGTKFNVGDVSYGLQAAAQKGWIDVIDEAFRNPRVKEKLGAEEAGLRKSASRAQEQVATTSIDLDGGP